MNYREYIENYSDVGFMQQTPDKLAKILNSYSVLWDTYVEGRTFKDALNSMNRTFSSLSNLFKLINYHTGRTIYFHAGYRSYSTDTAPTSVASLISDRYAYRSATDTEFFRINLVHIPRGTTFVADVLERAEQANEIVRLKHIELQLINSPTHYIKVFEHNVNGQSNVTILTNWIDKSLIHKVLLFTPILMHWNIIEEDKLKELAEKQAEEYPSVYINNAIPAIFDALFRLWNEQITGEEVTQIYTEICNNIIRLKELDKVHTESFINNLSHAVNKKIIANTKRDYETVVSNIRSYEENLKENYAKKEVLERRMLMQSSAQPDDVKALIDTINNNKAIEIIDANEDTLTILVTAPLQFFTSSDFERYEENTTSYYNLHSYGTDAKYTKPIFHKIFITHEYKLLLSAYVELRVDNSSYTATTLEVRARGVHTSGISHHFKSVPNPHLYFYDCWSKSKTMIQKATTEKNYDLIPILIINSVQTINIAETQSFFKLLNCFEQASWRNKVKILTKEGKEISWDEAVNIEIKNYESMVTPIKETQTEEPIVTEEVTTPRSVEGYTQIVVEDEEVLAEPIDPDNL